MTAYPFTYKTLDDLRAASDKLGLQIPISEDLSVLGEKTALGASGVILDNRLIVHPMEGFDTTEDGAPDDLTMRRYERFAKSGASMGWCEAISVCEEGRSNKHQMWIHKGNLDAYKRMVDMFHETSGGKPIIAQMTHSGRFSAPEGTLHPLVLYKNPLFDRTKFHDIDDIPLVTDDYLDSLIEKYHEATALAVEAGFDGKIGRASCRERV